ncbi:MAG: hypothetical protein ACRC31_05685 [Cetobacterium sp.]
MTVFWCYVSQYQAFYIFLSALDKKKSSAGTDVSADLNDSDFSSSSESFKQATSYSSTSSSLSSSSSSSSSSDYYERKKAKKRNKYKKKKEPEGEEEEREDEEGKSLFKERYVVLDFIVFNRAVDGPFSHFRV